MKSLWKVAMIAMLGLFITGPAMAADYDFSGNFRYDNDRIQFAFTVGSTSTVTVFSSSWLSGDGKYGFDPMLGIFSSTGTLIAFQDDGHNVGSTQSNGVWYNHGYWDSYYQVTLSPGSYIATVTQYNNFPTGGLNDPWSQDGRPNFTYLDGFGGATQPYFNGVWDDNDPRTNNWEFHLLNVGQASVPIPGAILLLGPGLVGLGMIRKRFSK